MHSIRNLALVDKETNSAMQNYLLDRKRSILMGRHDSCDISNPKNLKGTYAPPATRKVFCKEYSRCSPGDMRYGVRKTGTTILESLMTYMIITPQNKQEYAQQEY